MFKDVPPTHWAYNLIKYMFKKKAVGGDQNGNFRPDDFITRAETLSMVHKAQEFEYELIRDLLPSAVKVTAKLSDGRGSLGTGVVLDKQGRIATNCHCILDGIDPSKEVIVYLDDIYTGIPAKILYGDLSQDIAILQVAADPVLLYPIEFPDEQVRLADKVFCIGNPLGLTDTVSAGIVSCVKRVIGISEWIQTDAAINPGNSGGGAFNVKGQFIGLPTFIYVWADEEKTIPVSNIGFISPHYMVKEVYNKALAGKMAFTGKLIREVVLAQLFL